MKGVGSFGTATAAVGGLGVAADPATQPVAPTLPAGSSILSNKPGVPSLSLLPGAITGPDSFLLLGGSILAGAVVGGLSDDDWRGAFVGAGSMAALVSGAALVRSWATSDKTARLVLGVGGGVSAAIAAGVYLRRRRTRRFR